MAAGESSIRVQDLTGAEKAAIFMISLGSDVAGQVMAHLPQEEIESLAAQIARVDDLPKDAVEGVVKEYEQTAQAMGAFMQQGREFAEDVLIKAVGPEEAAAIIERVKTALDPSGFEVLNEIDDEQLLGFIRKEHPQTIALILGHLKPRQAARIMGQIAAEKQTEIVARMATIEKVSPDMVGEVKESLNALFSSWKGATGKSVGGVEVVAEILNLLERSTEKKIMGALETEDPTLAAKIKSFLFTFEDVLKLTDDDLRTVLKEVDSSTLVLAMKAASEELKEKIFGNISQRAAEMLRDEMEFMGPVRLKNVEESQARVIDVILRLDEAGQITIARSGEGEEIVA
ncbi:MAG: flagellar motor switch protein FliG [Candidatus Eisenbacteria sp.]|nr:flagellar motor switch protein FliG [Candidatus Eisenbacteria bacterium]